jgi:hypothetical protein
VDLEVASGSRRRRAKCLRRKAVARFVCYTTRCDFIFRWRRGQPATDNRCRSATIAVRRPRVTAPAAARVGRARALPVWRAAAPAARRAAGGSRRTPPAAWVSTLRNLKRWRAPTPDGGTTAARPRMATWRPRLSLSLSRAWSNPEPGSSELCRHQEATFQPAAPPLASLRAWQDAVTIHVRQHARQRLHPLHTLGPYLGAGGQQQREGHGGEARPPHRAVSHLLMLLEDVERLLVMPGRWGARDRRPWQGLTAATEPPVGPWAAQWLVPSAWCSQEPGEPATGGWAGELCALRGRHSERALQCPPSTQASYMLLSAHVSGSNHKLSHMCSKSTMSSLIRPAWAQGVQPTCGWLAARTHEVAAPTA